MKYAVENCTHIWRKHRPNLNQIPSHIATFPSKSKRITKRKILFFYLIKVQMLITDAEIPPTLP